MTTFAKSCLAGKAPVMFDVGANSGGNSLPLAAEFPNARIFAFEPTPELADRLRHQAPPNYIVIQKAVDASPGRKVFNVSGVDDWGRSSLNEFRLESANAFGDASGLNVVTHVAEVDCIRLDDFCRENNIDCIQYLHVDTQGSDMSVLESFGDLLPSVQAGVVEVARTAATRLYHQSPTRFQMASFLFDKGFQIEFCEPNDYRNAEQNIYFVKSANVMSRCEFKARYYAAITRGWPRGLKNRLLARIAVRTRVRRLLDKVRPQSG